MIDYIIGIGLLFVFMFLVVFTCCALTDYFIEKPNNKK